jgi:predicted GIY-YIG superfamily endonuclease
MQNNNKYNKFVIYKIYQNDDPNMLYIGSTINFNRRKSQHKKNTLNRCSKHYKQPLYQYIRGLGGFDKFTMEKVEDYPCKTKQEGLKREKELIDLYKAKLNIIKPI